MTENTLPQPINQFINYLWSEVMARQCYINSLDLAVGVREEEGSAAALSYLADAKKIADLFGFIEAPFLEDAVQASAKCARIEARASICRRLNLAVRAIDRKKVKLAYALLHSALVVAGNNKINISPLLSAVSSALAIAVKGFFGAERRGEEVPKVYFYLNEDGYVKIGRTIRPLDVRAHALKCGSHAKAEMIYSIEGGAELEAKLHKMFKQYRRNGEWFLFSDEIKAFIEKDKANKRTDACLD